MWGLARARARWGPLCTAYALRRASPRTWRADVGTYINKCLLQTLMFVLLLFCKTIAYWVCTRHVANSANTRDSRRSQK